MQRTQRSFYKERKRRRERFVLLKRTQKNARTLSSFEKNGCPICKKLWIVVVGISHARHMAEALEGMGAAVSLLKIHSCRSTTAAIDKAAAELSTAIGGDEDVTVVFQFLDNAAYYPRTKDGCLVPAKRDEESIFHLVGIWWKLQRKCFSTLWKRTKLETILTRWPVAQAGSNDEKNWKSKILLDCPFK